MKIGFFSVVKCIIEDKFNKLGGFAFRLIMLNFNDNYYL